MIDKSIRQHYQTGEKVNPFRKGMEIIMPRVKEQIKSQALPSEGRKIPNIIRAPLQRTALSKLGLGALNPVLGLLSLFGIDPLGWAGRKLTEGGVGQAFTAGMTGFGSPAEGRELRQLEARRANMLRRKEEGKSYSQKNLEEVTNRINKIKEDPYEFEDKKTEQLRPQIIPKTPEVIIPHLEGDRTIPTPTTVTRDVGLGDAGIAERIAAENRAAATQAAAIKAENDRQQREADAAAAAAARAAAARAYTPPVRHHTGGNGGGRNGGGGRGSSPSDAPGTPFKKGGRVDKALGGRSRDIG